MTTQALVLPEVSLSRQIVQTHLAEIRAALVQAESRLDIKRIIDTTAILADAAKKAHLSLETVNEVQEIRLDAEIKLGHELIRAKDKGELDPRNTLKRGPVVVANDNGVKLSDYGISRDLSSRSQALAQAEKDIRSRTRELLHRKEELSVLALFDQLRRVIKNQRKEQKRQKHSGQFRAKREDYTLQCCDLREARILPDSIDVIITDPPYPQQFLSCFEYLAQCAAKCLVPGGSLLAMSGQSYFPEVLECLCSQRDLCYHWLVCYLTPGGQSVQIFPRSVNTFWKPIVWLVKGEYRGDWTGDVTRSLTNDNDKRFHQWGQSESGIADLVTRFSLPGQLILDPFCGAGTTGLIALQLGRRFLGIDKDPNSIQKTKDRLEELFS